MNSHRKPRVGDRVQIVGFTGAYEVVRVERNGLMVDLKHLGHSESDYIEKQILAHELRYVGNMQATSPAKTVQQKAS
jgi:hypothetical protein